MTIKAKKLEIYGLSMILLSFFCQTFLLNQSSNLTDGARRYKLDKKIDTVYEITRDNYQVLHPKLKTPYFIANPDHLSDYAYAEQNEALELTEIQTSVFDYITAFIFILGSVLMIWAKCIEYLVEKSSNHAIKADEE